MYSQPINLNTDDEYLMGKEKEPEKEDEELKKVQLCHRLTSLPDSLHILLRNCLFSSVRTALADEGRYQVVTNQGISQAFIEKQKDPAKAWRDDMNKIRDDPLLAIKQAEKRQREKIMDNPLKIMQFKEVCLSRRDTPPSVDTLPSGSATLGARQRRGFSHELPRATGSRPNYDTIF